MIIPTGGNRSRQHNPRSIHRLEDSAVVDSPRDFLDEDRCQSFGTQLLVHTQEINFHAWKSLLVCAYCGGYGRYERNEFVRFGRPDA